jgi:hypothetical protein
MMGDLSMNLFVDNGTSEKVETEPILKIAAFVGDGLVLNWLSIHVT